MVLCVSVLVFSLSTVAFARGICSAGCRRGTGEDDRDLLKNLKRSTVRVSKRLGGVLTKEAFDLLEVCCDAMKLWYFLGVS